MNYNAAVMLPYFYLLLIGANAASVLPRNGMHTAAGDRPEQGSFLRVDANKITKPEDGSMLEGDSALREPNLMNKKDEKKPKFGKSKKGESEQGVAGVTLVPTTTQKLTSLQCGQTQQVGSKSDKYEMCPANCPYWAQNRKDTKHCTFLCVAGDDCAEWNPNKPIPDTIKRSKTCRGPKVDFCKETTLDGKDTCAKCMTGWTLYETDGHCYFSYWNTIIGSLIVIAAIVLFLFVWVIDLCCRESTNDDEVARARKFRSRSKILQPRNGREEKRRTYPIDSNMCMDPAIAGPGMLLHFNFQAFFIIWPLFVAIVWTILACFHNELFILGTRKFGTPRHNCILVAWGYETQQRLMWTKVLFLAIVYVVSFVSFMLFSIRQNRIYEQMDASLKSMKDFAVELKGLPPLSGTTVEKDIQKTVEDATKVNVVGVSVCWHYTEVEEKVMQVINAEITEAEKDADDYEPRPEIGDPTENMGYVHKQMYNAETKILGPDKEEEMEVQEIVTMIEGLKSSESAFIVFNTEEDKLKAMQAAETSGIKLKQGSKVLERSLWFEDLECEPINVNWQNFGDSGFSALARRFLFGFCKWYLPALAIWFFVFYIPYAWSLYNFNYDNGAELPGYYSIVFTMVVVGGNATMYVICDICGEEIRFRYKDTKQAAYMLMYLFACMFNVFLDMVVTYYTALKIMVGLDFRTYDGTRLSEVNTFTEQFETYAMQRSLAENAYRYAFPSTFLIPFLLEPIVTITVPYLIGVMVIRTHREVRGICAENYIAAFEFDLGRYADILLNVFLGILIFYFPGGYTWSLFYGMFISHIVIYLFDHWRVLRVIPKVKIVNRQVDWWAQATMAACCGMIMSCLVFKANCETYSGYCVQDVKLIAACSIAGVAHFLVHMILLIYVVPALGKEYPDKNPGKEYKEIAALDANTWFSKNPVHCLRSKYIHQHSPHCRYAAVGKDHLLQVNESIGCYFSDEPAEDEDYSPSNNTRALARSVTSFQRSTSKTTDDEDETPRTTKSDA